MIKLSNVTAAAKGGVGKTDLVFLSFPDVALSSSLLCHDPGSPTQGCCSDGTVLLGGFGGPLNANLTVSSVEYLGPEEHPSPGTSAISPPGVLPVKITKRKRHCTVH